MRSKIVAGNWKSNLLKSDAEVLAQNLCDAADSISNEVEVIIAPPFAYLGTLPRCEAVQLSSQNCSATAFGAYTGEVAAEMLVSMGVNITILGHSERRSYFGETDEVVAGKVKRALEGGLRVIFCCGEQLEERESGKHFDVVKAQVDKALFDLSSAQMKSIVIAYEPVWAIGTGKTASADQAQEMHAFIRGVLAEKFGSETADNTSILYGGSCKPSNADEIFAKPDVDGGLIGGASLKADDFLAIVQSRAK